MTTAQLTAMTREMFGWMARVANLPRFEQAHIEAHFGMVHPLPDTGNNYPSVKAAIDGLRDAGVLVDDTSEYVLSILLHAPYRVMVEANQHMTLVLRSYGVAGDCPTCRRSWADLAAAGGVCSCGQSNGGTR